MHDEKQAEAGKIESLRFAVAQRGGAVREVTICIGEVAFLGRDVKGAVVVADSSVSTQHVEFTVSKSPSEGAGLVLLARDKSQNGTGVCKPGFAAQPDLDGLWRLGSKPEVLEHGYALVVPLRRKGQQARLLEVNEKTLFHIYVHGCSAASWPPTPIPLFGRGAGAMIPARVPDKILDTKGLPDCYDVESGTGRWRYQARLGEGGLGVVYSAVDATGQLGNVAIKVLKHPERAFWGKQHCFSMHRECQWSLQKLHNTEDARYRPDTAKLFARYLEDHTGLEKLFPGDFDERRRHFEAPNLDWEKQSPTPVAQPYVVMELVAGEALHVAIDREWRAQQPKNAGIDLRPLTLQEKREVFLQAAKALEYMVSFRLIHRDYRGCNMHLEVRRTGKVSCRLKVLDLGVMITDEDCMQSNTNDAVQAFRKRGDTAEKKRRYDWLPWEVRAAADGEGPPLNFEKPVHSFDMFSLGVLALHLLIGRVEARALLGRLEKIGLETWSLDTISLGLDPALHRRMLGEAKQRPTPTEVVQAVEASLATQPVSDAVVSLASRREGMDYSGQKAGAGEQKAYPEVTLSRTRSSSPTLSPPRRGLPPLGAAVAAPGQAAHLNNGVKTSMQVGARSRSCSSSSSCVSSSHEGTHEPANSYRQQQPLQQQSLETVQQNGSREQQKQCKDCSRSRSRRIHQKNSRSMGRRSRRHNSRSQPRADFSEDDSIQSVDADAEAIFRALRAACGDIAHCSELASVPKGRSDCWVLTFPLSKGSREAVH
eukprot:TRINITY_DN23121_c0_g1_i1.p1 TRINITY_DN23121_c0_g1~~TRINITY_DN23121_c0_g1_i1.p1  ORF type:complete len:765 (+),score=141.21 TRINITY_DN23121_c0_g1_i1:83-2377(+)